MYESRLLLLGAQRCLQMVEGVLALVLGSLDGLAAASLKLSDAALQLGGRHRLVVAADLRAAVAGRLLIAVLLHGLDHGPTLGRVLLVVAQRLVEMFANGVHALRAGDGLSGLGVA